MNDLVVEDIVEMIKEAATTDANQKITSGSILVLPLDTWITIPAVNPRSLADSDKARVLTMHAS
jgi:nitrogen regulatory protein PII